MSIYIYFGLPGAGKSCGGSVDTQSVPFDWDRMRSSADVISKYNKTGFNFSYPDHLLYSNLDIFCYCRGFLPVKSHFVDGYDIGLPNPYHKTVVFPPYSFIVIDEAQRYFYSKSGQSLPRYVTRWFEMHRQQHYDIILICQRPTLIDKDIRDLAQFREFIKVDNTQDRYGRFTKSVFYFRDFNSNAEVENYLTTHQVPHDCKIQTKVFNDDISLIYDSFAFSKMFLPDDPHEDFTMKYQNYTFDKFEDYAKFKDENSYLPPLGYYQTKQELLYGKKNNRN